MGGGGGGWGRGRLYTYCNTVITGMTSALTGAYSQRFHVPCLDVCALFGPG